MRGEGATLLGADGERFTDELAPRDAVTLAVLDQMSRDGTDHVLLDMRELSEARFPSVFTALRQAGHDPLREPIPVAPASHYVMGGIATDGHGRVRRADSPAPASRQTIEGLYAAGACTGGLEGGGALGYVGGLIKACVFGLRSAEAAARQIRSETA